MTYQDAYKDLHFLYRKLMKMDENGPSGVEHIPGDIIEQEYARLKEQVRALMEDDKRFRSDQIDWLMDYYDSRPDMDIRTDSDDRDQWEMFDTMIDNILDD